MYTSEHPKKTCVYWWTHCGLVTPYGDRDLGQPWLRKWLGAWRHQAITWTNVDLSSARSSDIHLRASSQEIITQPSITEIIWKIKYLKFHSNSPGANELITHLVLRTEYFSKTRSRPCCWCPGSSFHQVISSHSIGYIGWMGLCLPWGRFYPPVPPPCQETIERAKIFIFQFKIQRLKYT